MTLELESILTSRSRCLLLETSSVEAKIQIALPDIVEGFEPVEPVMVSSAVGATK